MFWKTDKLAELRKALLKRLKQQAAPDIRLLGEGQMVIRKGMIPNPAAGRGLKAVAEIPGPDGYEIYLARRPHTGETSASAQLMSFQPTVWDPQTMTLQLDPAELSQSWQLVSADRQLISIRVRSGSPALVAEVNQILERIAALLL